MVRVTHTVHDNGGVEGVMARIKAVAKQKVCVGVMDNGTGRRGGDIGNADLMYIQTNGVRPTEVRHAMQPEIDKGTPYSIALQMHIHSRGSFIMRIPPRPVIEPAIEDAKASISKLLISAVTAAVAGEDCRAKLEDAGMYAQTACKDWFDNPKNGWPHNADGTINGWQSPWGTFYPGKGFDKPLVNTGALRNSIVYVIRG